MPLILTPTLVLTSIKKNKTADSTSDITIPVIFHLSPMQWVILLFKRTKLLQLICNTWPKTLTNQ